MKRVLTAVAAAMVGVAMLGVAGLSASAQTCYPPGSPACAPAATAPPTTSGPQVQGTSTERASVSVDSVVADLQTSNPALAQKVTAAAAQLDSVDLNNPSTAGPALAAFFEAMKEALPDFHIATITTMTVQNPDGTFSTAAVTVTKDPVTGEVGLVSVGAGYAPGSKIQIFVESTPILLGEVSATNAGKFMSAVKIPGGLEPGSHTLVARGTDASGKPHVTGQPIALKAPEGAGESASGDVAAPAPAKTSGGGMSGGAAVLLVLIAAAIAAAVFFLSRNGRMSDRAGAGAE
jgi:hypothetical protein